MIKNVLETTDSNKNRQKRLLLSLIVSFSSQKIYNTFKIKDNTLQKEIDTKGVNTTAITNMLSTSMTKNIDNPTLRNEIRIIDSLSYDSYFNNITTDRDGFYTVNHSYNDFIEPSIPNITVFMKQHNIQSVRDIIKFSNQFSYQDSIKKQKLYNELCGFCWIQKVPAQTLIEKTGDCDDLTLLYYTMFTIIKSKAIIVSLETHTFLLIDPIEFQKDNVYYTNLIGLDKKKHTLVESSFSVSNKSHRRKENIENIVYYSIFETTAWEYGLLVDDIHTDERKNLYSNEVLISR